MLCISIFFISTQKTNDTNRNKEDFRALCSKELKVVEAGIRAHPKSYWVWFQVAQTFFLPFFFPN